MSQVRVNESSLVDIANAIREKNATTNSYKPSELGNAVRALDGKIPAIEAITITENGEYTATGSLDGYSPITVNVEPNNTTISITANGTYTPDGYDGYSEVTVDVQPNNTTIEITTNGTYTPDGYDGFSEVIVNTPPSLEPEDLIIGGDCSYMFKGGNWSGLMSKFSDIASTKDITKASYMFDSYPYEQIPFDELNFQQSTGNKAHELSFMFSSSKITTVPKFNNCRPSKMENIFNGCQYLRELPEDFGSWFDWTYYTEYLPSIGSGSFNTNRSNTFNGCWSLRKVPEGFMTYDNPAVYQSYTMYYYAFAGCYTLDEVLNIGVPYTTTYTSNIFGYMVDNCNRLKNFTFALNNGQPYQVKWKSQTIDFTKYVGYTTSSQSYITGYNSGITVDKKVSDDATYQALKNDPDWWASTANYSRYNHDSAVATINSLPDTSAYLATQSSGTNTIKFYAYSGLKTDGGAINTLTAEEIAVAAAKGWTVTMTEY